MSPEIVTKKNATYFCFSVKATTKKQQLHVSVVLRP